MLGGRFLLVRLSGSGELGVAPGVVLIFKGIFFNPRGSFEVLHSGPILGPILRNYWTVSRLGPEARD